MWVAKYRYEVMVEMLLEAGADPFIKNKEGKKQKNFVRMKI